MASGTGDRGDGDAAEERYVATCMGVFSVKHAVVGCATGSSVTSQLLTDVGDMRHAVLAANGILWRSFPCHSMNH